MKKTICFIVGALALLLTPQVWAQSVPLRPHNPMQALPKMSAAEIAAGEKHFEADYPLVAKGIPYSAPHTGLTEVRPVIPFRSVASAMGTNTAASASTFWAVVPYSQGWPASGAGDGSKADLCGVYAFTVAGSGPYALDSLKLNPAMAGIGGAAVVDGIYYKFYCNTLLLGWDMISANLFSYDITTWEPTETNGEDMSDHIDMFGTATCQAPDGTVYGEFFTAFLNGYEYGIVDYENKTRTVIGPAHLSMVAMGISGNGTWYGIASDGNLYTIDKETGAETLVGATGLTLEKSDGKYYLQSGAIDPKTDIFYWCPFTATKENGVYTVDLATGAATKIGNFEGGEAQVYDMIVAPTVAEEDAPAKATQLSATFTNGSTSGTIGFKAPTRNFADDANLSGTLRYSVVLHKDTIASGTCKPGATVSTEVSVPEGQHKFVVITANAAGPSPRASVSAYVGFDTPKAPAKVSATWAADNTSAQVTWTPVNEGVHKGFLGPITYKVVRMTGLDSTVVAESTSSNTVADTSIPTGGSLKNVRYIVRAVNGTKAGAWASSAGHAIGSPFTVPYVEEFTDSANVPLFTIINANNDNRTWYYYDDNPADPFMRILYNSAKAMDDWLITPPISFEGGREYTLSFKSYGAEKYVEKMQVKFGTANTVAGLTTEILPATEMRSDTVFHLSFTPPADGIYYLGFHGCSDKDKYWTKVDSIVVRAGSLPTSPAAPELTVVPAAKGALKATVTVKAPTKTIEGNNLSADQLKKIVVRRDSVDVKTFFTPAPGATLTFADTTVPADGIYTYTATPYDGDEAGKQAEASAYVGLDKPKNVQHAKAFDNSSSAHLVWDAPSEEGVNGGYVDPATLKTLVWSVDPDGGFLKNVIDTLTNATSYDVVLNTNEGEPMLARWGLQNMNRMGTSPSIVGVNLPVGTPYTLPFVESVAEGKIENKWWLNRQGGTSSTNQLAYTTDDAADDDGGSFIYAATADDVNGSFNTFKIDLGNAVNPNIVFSYDVKSSAPTTKGRLQVEVQTLDGTSSTVYTSDALVADAGWTQQVVSLSKFAGKVILVKFHFFCETQPVTIGLDKIRIQDIYAHDLSLTLSAPESVIKGQPINAVMKITNEGTSGEKAYTVKLFVDGTEVKTIDETNELAAFGAATYAVSIPTSAFPTDKTEKVLKAKVDLEGDLRDANDEATDIVATQKSTLPKPENLTAADAQPHVFLTWAAPPLHSEPFTDDFESYTPFAVDALGQTATDLGGGWTTIDGQAGQTPAPCLGRFWANYPYPGQYKPGSFLIFNAESLAAGLTNVNPFALGHNKSYQCAAMPYESADKSYIDGDNYLVSPALTGEAQTVTFYAKNACPGYVDYPEKFEFLYSTAGKAKEDFTNVVIPDTLLRGGEWQYFEAPLPAEATYFAIHQTSDASGAGDYLFSVDDVTFLKGAKPSGYNIYCDGELIGSVTADGMLAFYGDAPEGMHQWSVTAIYPDGQESEPVSVTAATDISSIVANGEPFDVYTLDGVLVRSQAKDTEGLKSGVYIVNDKKVIIK